MNVINAYLDSMFSAYEQTSRMLEAKAELQGMMEDAYTGLIAEGRSENEAVGQVIRDFGNLEEVAPVLGIASDVSGASAADARAGSGSSSAPQHPRVTLEEAHGYADALKRGRVRLSIAVPLFVLSPAVLITLPVAAEAGVVELTENVGAFVGLMVLFVLVAIGVMLLVTNSRDTAPYERLTDGDFTSSPEVDHWVEALAGRHERGRIRALQIAITLWILAPIPLLAFSLLIEDSPRADFWVVIGVALVLVLVAAGLAIFLPKNWANSVAETLTSGDSDDGDDDDNSVVGVIAAFYWPVLVVIYLSWSFIGNAWGISWIVWPIGGVLFGAIAGGIGALEDYRRSR